VSGVTGLEEGCYYAPKAQELRQIGLKLPAELHYLCLGQELGRMRGGAVPQRISKHLWLSMAIVYRYLHMDAGHLGQRLNFRHSPEFRRERHRWLRRPSE